MRYKKRNGAVMGIAAGICAVVIIGAGVFLSMRIMKPVQSKNVEVIATQDSVNMQGAELTEECTLDRITFKVGNEWTKIAGKDATFMHSDGVSVYSITGNEDVSLSDDADKFYTDLLKEYMDMGFHIDAGGLKTMKPYKTADGKEGYIGRISFTKEDEVYSETEIVIIPDSHYLVAVSVECPKDHQVPLDVRSIMDTVIIND